MNYSLIAAMRQEADSAESLWREAESVLAGKFSSEFSTQLDARDAISDLAPRTRTLREAISVSPIRTPDDAEAFAKEIISRIDDRTDRSELLSGRIVRMSARLSEFWGGESCETNRVRARCAQEICDLFGDTREYSEDEWRFAAVLAAGLKKNVEKNIA